MSRPPSLPLSSVSPSSPLNFFFCIFASPCGYSCLLESGATGGGADDAGAAGAAAASRQPPPRGTYHNAFRACEGRLYLLGRQELRAVRVQGWSQRVESLVQAGEWLEALAVALDHFEQKILPAENAAAAAAAAAAEAAAAAADEEAAAIGGASVHGSDGGYSGGGGGGGYGAGMRHTSSSGDLWGGVRGTGAEPGFGDQRRQLQRRPAPPRSEAAEHISDLLAQYLRLAINNAPTAEPFSHSGPGVSGAAAGAAAQGAGSPGGGGGGSRINLAHSHFQMLAGVCAEFCAVTGRLDMLFGQIFHAFRARGQQGWVVLLFWRQRVMGFCCFTKRQQFMLYAQGCE